MSQVQVEEEVLEEIESLRSQYEGIVEEVPLLSEGDTVKCKVVMIKIGKMGDFINIDKIQNDKIRERLEQVKDRKAIQVACYIPDLDTTFHETIMFSVHENSKYRRIARKYKKLKVGMELEAQAYNKNEYLRFKIV